jgi:PmbA protein
MTEDLLTAAQDAVAQALKLGADAADSLAVDAQGTDVELREGAIEKLERTEATGLGLRVFIGNSSALISGSVLTREALHKLADTAVAMARATPPDPFAGLAGAAELARSLPALDLVSDDLPDAAALQTMAREVEAAALAVPGVSKSGGAGAAASLRVIALVTSQGFAQSYRRSNVSFSVSAIAGSGTQMERDYDYSSAVHVSDLKSVAEVGQSAGARAVRRLHPRKVPSQAVPVIYDRRVASSLVGHLSAAINGAAIARGTGFLKDSMGQPIFRPGIRVSDDPLRPRGLASRPFDGEGLASREAHVIDDGRLQAWLLDLRAARQLGLSPSANAARGLGSPPSPSASNLFLNNGHTPLADMISAIKTGFYVTELIGNSVNMVTGDYSRGASGFWIENGELAFPVSSITIAGNLRQMFAALEPATDLAFTSTTNAPSCLVTGMTIAGS